MVYIYTLLSIFLWSTVAVAFKLTLRYLSVIEVIFFSSIWALVFLFIINLINGNIKQIKELKGKEFFLSIILGLLNPCIYYALLFTAYNMLYAHEALILNYTWAIVLTLLSALILKHRTGILGVCGLLLGFFGVVMVATHGSINNINFPNTTGFAVALLSAFVWALYWILNTKDKIAPGLRLFLNFFYGTVFIGIFMLFRGIHIPHLFPFLGTIYIGLFEMGVTYILWGKALKLSRNTTRISTYIYITPFLSLIFIYLILKEPIYFSSIIGLIFIIGGILMQHIRINNNVSLKEEVNELIKLSINTDRKLELICSAIKRNKSYYDWVGFYIVKEDKKLHLVCFKGEPTEHKEIEFGKGICGQTAISLNTFIVQDVEKEENYLSCSPDVKSEIVIPIFNKDGMFVAELDIDSHTLNAFKNEDRKLLEEITKIIGEKLF